ALPACSGVALHGARPGAPPPKKTRPLSHRLSHPPRPTLYLHEYYECPIAAGAGVVCHECGSENASMNLVCAYCRVPFMADRVAVVRCEDMPSAQVLWGVFAAALVV